jgi:hypothetical protein
MIASGWASTICCHHAKVSPLTTPPGFPPRVPRPTVWVGSFLGWFVAVAHHETEEVSDPERIALPGALNWIGAFGGIDSGERRVLAQRVHPLLPPPGIRFIQPTAVMIATDIVDRFPLVLGEGLELAHHLGPLLILRDPLAARHISHIDGEVPRKWGSALGPAGFRVDDGLGQTIAAMALVDAHVGIAEGPEPQGVA